VNLQTPITKPLEFDLPENVQGAAQPTGAIQGDAGASARPPVRKRAYKWTKFRLLRVKAAEPGAVLDDDERARLLKFHWLRLTLKGQQMAELLELGAVRLLASDEGEGALLDGIGAREEIYRAAAAGIGEHSTLDDVLRVRRVHHLSRPSGMERPPACAIAAAERFMPDDPSTHDYNRLLCGGSMAQILIAERKARLGGSHRYVRPVAGASAATLLDRAPADLRAYLEDRGFGRIREVPAHCAAQLLACGNDMLFGLGLLRLEQLLRTTASRHTYHQMLLVKQIANTADDDDLSTLVGVDRFATEYCLDRSRYPKDPESRRNNVGQFLLESHIQIDREIRGAEPAVAAVLARYLFPLPRMPAEFASRIAKARRKQIADGQKVRKDRVEPFAQSLPESRFLAGSRAAELRHDQKCCAAAMAEAARLNTSQPLELGFSYDAPIYDEDGRRVPGLQRRYWTLRNTNRIHEMMVELTDERFARRSLPGGDTYSEAYDTEWWLFYERSEGVDGSQPRDPWLAGAIDSLVLYTGRGLPPELVKRQMAFAKANGLNSNLASRLRTGFAWYGGDQGKRARRVVVDLGLRPFPVNELCHGILVAHAGTSVMTTSGARTHEFFQIVQDPSRFYRLELAEGESRFVFLAVPKGFDEAVPYVIINDDAKAVWAMARFASDRFHGGQPIPVTPPAPALRDKCGPGRYAVNVGARPMDPSAFNPLVQLLFVGRHELEAYDMRHGFASYAEGTGVPIEVIAAWLNQKALDVTRYYAKAPKTVRDRWWLQFHTVVDLREFKGSAPLLMDAEKAAAVEKVGALTSVPGGTCVSLGECPIRFSCIGCRCNAADPDKREEVVASRVAASSLRDVWARNGRVKAVEEQERTIESHNAMLREMDLVERYRAMRDEVVKPDLRIGRVVPAREVRA